MIGRDCYHQNVTSKKPSEIATSTLVDGYTITMYNSGNKGEKDNV